MPKLSTLQMPTVFSSSVSWPPDTTIKSRESLTKNPAVQAGRFTLVTPKAMLLLMQAKAHALGGEPLSAMPPALAAMALAEKASLLGLRAAAALELVAVQLNVDPPRALSLLSRVRAQIMRNGSAFEVARLQLLSAQCRLAMLPPHSDSNPLRIEQLQPTLRLDQLCAHAHAHLALRNGGEHSELRA